MENKNYKAIVIGGTGLIGRYLVENLINDELCTKVTLLVRHDIKSWHEKLYIHTINFDDKNSYQSYLKGDVLFSTFGTTRLDAKNKENHYKVDHDYQYNIAKSAKQNGIENYILVSSPLLNENSSNYYRRMKWEIERDIKSLNFSRTIILRPNPLIGKRSNKRFGEHYATKILLFIINTFSILKKFKPILAKNVAKAMIKSYKDTNNYSKGVYILERTQIDEYL